MKLEIAKVGDIDVLIPLVSEYHRFENIESTDSFLEKALLPLLGENNLGRIWLILSSGEVIGYIVLCFGYSIEFAARDAFIDEFYIKKPFRGQGIGKTVLATIIHEAKNFGIAVLHLEVGKTNARAQKFYSNMGFRSREKYQIMSYHT